MNTKQLREMAKEQLNSGHDGRIWLWRYSNGQLVWVSISKSNQLDKQRNDDSHADL